MKNLLEAINKGILRGLHENNIELLADLDDSELDLLDSLLTKNINNRCNAIDRQLQSTIRTVARQLQTAILCGSISNELLQLINDPSNFDTFKGIIKANDKGHLKELVLIGLKLLGYDGNFNWIDTSRITDMSKLFSSEDDFGGCNVFNGHIELWDVSNVTNMQRMFYEAESFNLPIGDWDVSNVTALTGMFLRAEKFNLPLNNWSIKDNANINFIFGGCPIKEEYKFA